MFIVLTIACWVIYHPEQIIKKIILTVMRIQWLNFLPFENFHFRLFIM